MFEIVVPLLTSTPWSELKYGVEKSTTLARSSVIVTCESARSKSGGLPGDQRVERHVHDLDLVEAEARGDVGRHAVLEARR